MKSATIALTLSLSFLATSCAVEIGGYYDDGYGQPPQNWAQLYSPPYGCESGPFSVAIINQTDLYVAMAIDGADIDFQAEDGSYAELFPRTTAYLCLESTGFHTLDGQAYTERYDYLVPIEGPDGSFATDDEFGISVAPSGRHEFVIDASLFNYY